jgi:hypothetical protein
MRKSNLPRSKYDSLYARLVANSRVPEDQSEATGCWLWTSRSRGKHPNSQYPRFNTMCDGKHKQLAAHRAMLVIMELAKEEEGMELFWPLYNTYSVAEFHADHLCEGSGGLCINPDHLQWLTEDEHTAKTVARNREPDKWQHLHGVGK